MTEEDTGGINDTSDENENIRPHGKNVGAVVYIL